MWEKNHKMEKKQNELTVIMRAKDLCSYIMTVTQKSPKHYRFTFVTRLQNISLDIIEHIYRANSVFIRNSDVVAAVAGQQ